MHLGADLLNDANHLVTNGNAWNGTRHTAVLDMQVAGADTAERNAHNGIARALQLGLRLVDKFELAMGYVSVGEHSIIVLLFVLIFRLTDTLHYIIYGVT